MQKLWYLNFNGPKIHERHDKGAVYPRVDPNDLAAIQQIEIDRGNYNVPYTPKKEVPRERIHSQG